MAFQLPLKADLLIWTALDRLYSLLALDWTELFGAGARSNADHKVPGAAVTVDEDEVWRTFHGHEVELGLNSDAVVVARDFSASTGIASYVDDGVIGGTLCIKADESGLRCFVGEDIFTAAASTTALVCVSDHSIRSFESSKSINGHWIDTVSDPWKLGRR